MIDAVGTLIGVALAFVVMYRGLGTWFSSRGSAHKLFDLGFAWPEASRLSWLTWSSACAFYLLLLFVLHQAFWQRIEVRAPNAVNIGIQIIWLAIAIFVVWAFWTPWMALGVGAVAGLVVTLVSQAGRLPILRADRAIGYFMVPWFLIVLGHWIFVSLGGLVWPYILIALQFLSLGNAISFWLEPAAIYFSWVLVTIAAIAGLFNIVRDRQMMVGDPAASARMRQVKEESVRSESLNRSETFRKHNDEDGLVSR